jgi:hypothetical protein
MSIHMLILGTIDLWNPSGVGLGIVGILATALLLGMVHGITPDEHTWPITFSYAVGSYSWKGGMRAGMLFSLAFTIQRSIMSELAYFALTDFAKHALFNFWVYIVIGAVMAASGFYVLKRGKILHMFHAHKMGTESGGANTQNMPKYMPLVHGFIAGFGTGAFALITYTALSPHMGSPWLAFLPGTFFGLGTMAMQVAAGALFGQWMAKRHLPPAARAALARLMSGRTLSWAGSAFVLVGIAGLIWPNLWNISINTHIHVHNLHSLGVGFFLAFIVLITVATAAFVKSIRDVSKMAFKAESPADQTVSHIAGASN